MGKKQNTTVRIKCETPQLAEFLFAFIAQGSSQIEGQIKNVIAQTGGGVSDPNFEDINFEKLTAEFKLTPTDKGDVMFLDENGQLSVIPYKELSSGEIYAEIRDGKVNIYRFKDNSLDEFFGSVQNVSHLLQGFKEIVPEMIREQEKKDKESKELKAAAETEEPSSASDEAEGSE